jgi:hypothetical protein
MLPLFVRRKAENEAFKRRRAWGIGAPKGLARKGPKRKRGSRRGKKLFSGQIDDERPKSADIKICASEAVQEKPKMPSDADDAKRCQ